MENKTLADKIRSMSDAELADWLASLLLSREYWEQALKQFNKI